MADFDDAPLIPPDLAVDPSEELAAIERELENPLLFGDAVLPELVVDPEPTTYPLGRGWAFDFQQERFVLGSAGRSPRPISGVDVLKQWVEKALLTERGVAPVHSDVYGMRDAFDVIGQSLSAIDTGDLAARVSEALLFHPKIVRVENFAFVSDDAGEALLGSFDVVTDDAQTVRVEGVNVA